MNKVGAKSRDDGTNKTDSGFYGVDRAKHGGRLSSSKELSYYQEAFSCRFREAAKTKILAMRAS